MKGKRRVLSILVAGAAIISCAAGFASCGEEEATEIIYVRCDAEGNESDEGGYIKFGSYPQAETTEKDVISALNEEAGDLPTEENSRSWTSYKYYIENENETDFMWYIDLEYEGEKYRGVYFTTYRPYWTEFAGDADYSFQDENGYRTGITYWFKYEPILWRILSEDEENGTAFIASETLIDSRHYYRATSSAPSTRSAVENYDDGYYAGEGETATKEVYANDYKFSDIRAWLNETFYFAAFTTSERSAIETTEVDNNAASTVDFGGLLEKTTSDGEDTSDKIFLLSEYEVTSEEYGFSSYYDYDTARQKKTSDYAKAQGAYTYYEDLYGYHLDDKYDGCGWWELRSPYDGYGDDANYAMGIDYTGFAYYLNNVNNASYGILPAMRISLK